MPGESHCTAQDNFQELDVPPTMQEESDTRKTAASLKEIDDPQIVRYSPTL